jgi:ATP-binding cassette subfamily C protein CydC
MAEPRPPWRPLRSSWIVHWRWLALGLVLAAAAAAAAVALLALAGWFISAAALAGLVPATAHLFNLLQPSVVIRVLAILRTAARYGERLVNHEATFRILASLRTQFYARLEPLAPAVLSAYRRGDLLNRIVADIDALDHFFLRVATPSVVAGLMLLAAGALLWPYSMAAAAILALGLALAAAALPTASLRAAARPGRRLTQQTALLRVHIVEGLQGLAELTVFGALTRMRQRIMGVHQALLAAQNRMNRIHAAATAGLVALSGLSAAGVLYCGAGLVEAGTLDGALLALMVFTSLAVFDTVWPLATAWQFWSRTRESARRLASIAGQEPAVAFGDRSTPFADPRIVFHRVTFRYQPQAPLALEDFDLEVPAGTRVAILGPSGAGKSTLLNLLVRFWDPDAGHVSLGGVDLRAWTEKSLRAAMAVVPQQAHLFAARLRDNLLLARPAASEADLWTALEAARLKTAVAAWPDGLDTWLGASGRLLSGGEARRLALAQAVLRDAPLWILDEPTEGLDGENEAALMQTIHRLTAGRTLLLITHRPTGLSQLDRIVVMENGRIVEDGRWDELLARGGRLTQMMDLRDVPARDPESGRRAAPP